MAEPEGVMEKLVSLCKRRGFVYQGSEIYGGLAGTYDYGPLGVALKANVKALWWKRFVLDRDDMYGLDAAILMNPKAWEASGHVAGFADPLVECAKCQKRFRVDSLIGEKEWRTHLQMLLETGAAQKEDPEYANAQKFIGGYVRKFLSMEVKCPSCSAQQWGEARQFNMMLKTHVGAIEDDSSVSYLRPETAGGMFVNFKNVVDSFHPKLPFGTAQIGKAFRNEIAPRDFLFRVREFEQMEIEYFVKPGEWASAFEELRKEMHEYTKERLIPHVVEPSFGVDRTVLAVLIDAYAEDEQGDEPRVFLKLSPKVAPFLVAASPLLKNKPQLVEKAKEVRAMLRAAYPGRVAYDDNGNIGKRYRRQDEIGTPYCVTVDFDTLEGKDNPAETVTLRHRDTASQERVAISDLVARVKP